MLNLGVLSYMKLMQDVNAPLSWEINPLQRQCKLKGSLVGLLRHYMYLYLLKYHFSDTEVTTEPERLIYLLLVPLLVRVPELGTCPRHREVAPSLWHYT